MIFENYFEIASAELLLLAEIVEAYSAEFETNGGDIPIKVKQQTIEII
jgi:hypothetical protein